MDVRVLFSRHFLIFITGGLISVAIDIGVMQLMISLEINPLFAATVGFFSGLIFNYLYHVYFTFKSTISLAKLMRFMIVVCINYIITIILIYISYSLLIVGVLPGKILSLPIVAANGYLLSKHWVFK